MDQLPASGARTFADVVLAVALVVGCAVLVAFGVVQWLLTVLQADFPCGEGYLVHPRCVLAHPERIDLADGLLVAAPSLCAARAVIGIALGIARRRRLALQAAVSFTIALACTLTGLRMLETALADRVPWS